MITRTRNNQFKEVLGDEILDLTVEEDELLTQGKLFLFGPITTRSIQKVIYGLHLYETRQLPGHMELYINSDGGGVEDAFALIDTMTSSPLEIHTIALGTIYSSALMIFIAGDKRIVMPSTTAMIHNYSDSFEGTYLEMKAKRREEDIVYDRMIEHFMKYSKYKTREEVLARLLLPTDNYLMPIELFTAGLCDKVGEYELS